MFTNFLSRITFFQKIIVQKSLHIRKACHLSFYLKKNRGSSPYPAEALGIFPEAVRNGTIFRFPAKNDQMTKRKKHIYIYHFVAYFMLILNISMSYW